jgi:hypothetical protein
MGASRVGAMKSPLWSISGRAELQGFICRNQSLAFQTHQEVALPCQGLSLQDRVWGACAHSSQVQKPGAAEGSWGSAG